ncbi:MAG: glycosyltransferase family 2 protein [Saccharospirillum sp.]|nr:glycosyltransferase family 2 protein [Saccharospirillum sp.]
MMETIKISLVIPAYNRNDLLGDLLSAATAQTVPYDAIIVVDDGSSEDTTAFIAENFSGVTCIRTPNRGTQHARNVGIQAAQTEWVTLCDSDDVLDPTYNERMLSIIAEDSSLDQIYSNFRFFNDESEQKDVMSKLPNYFFADAQTKPEYYVKVPNLLEKVMVNQFLWPSGMTIRYSALELLGFFDTSLRHVRSEDLEFTLRAISRLNIAISREPLVKIRKHGANQSADSINQLMGEITILQKFVDTTYFGYSKRLVIEQSIAKRRESLVVGLYDRQRFEDIVLLYKSKGPGSWSLKSRVKYFIARFPFRRVRLLLWKLSKGSA